MPHPANHRTKSAGAGWICLDCLAWSPGPAIAEDILSRAAGDPRVSDDVFRMLSAALEGDSERIPSPEGVA